VPADLTGPLVWQPGRRDLWGLAVSLWKERPLLGVGSDNYRHLYGARAGRAFWDTRVYANNTLLEAAATTGALGALALLLTLAFTLREGFRSQVPESAALFALAAGCAAHGVVDYLLAATGHYLLFGFVVGGIAGLPPAVPGEVA
jgi:O-antigen ligase